MGGTAAAPGTQGLALDGSGRAGRGPGCGPHRAARSGRQRQDYRARPALTGLIFPDGSKQTDGRHRRRGQPKPALHRHGQRRASSVLSPSANLGCRYRGAWGLGQWAGGSGARQRHRGRPGRGGGQGQQRAQRGRCGGGGAERRRLCHLWFELSTNGRAGYHQWHGSRRGRGAGPSHYRRHRRERQHAAVAAGVQAFSTSGYGVEATSGSTAAVYASASNSASSSGAVVGNNTNSWQRRHWGAGPHPERLEGVRGVASASNGYGVEGVGTARLRRARPLYQRQRGVRAHRGGSAAAPPVRPGWMGYSGSSLRLSGCWARRAAPAAATGVAGVRLPAASGCWGRRPRGLRGSGAKPRGSNGTAVFGVASGTNLWRRVRGRVITQLVRWWVRQLALDGRAIFSKASARARPTRWRCRTAAWAARHCSTIYAYAANSAVAVDIRQAGAGPGLRVVGDDTTTVLKSTSKTNFYALKLTRGKNSTAGWVSTSPIGNININPDQLLDHDDLHGR